MGKIHTKFGKGFLLGKREKKKVYWTLIASKIVYFYIK